MIAYVYKPKRRKAGKLAVQCTYRGRYRLSGQFLLNDVPLDTTDKQVAQTRLLALIQEKEREQAGLIAPKSERIALSKSVSEHLQEFLADLSVLGRSPVYRRVVKCRLGALIKECAFANLGDISTGRFIECELSKANGLAPKLLTNT